MLQSSWVVMGRKKKVPPKKNDETWICPVCLDAATAGTFICTFCEPPQYVHYACGGYKGGYKEVKQHDRNSLKCNNCKVSFLWYTQGIYQNRVRGIHLNRIKVSVLRLPYTTDYYTIRTGNSQITVKLSEGRLL